jgi:hypothetical protein
MSLNKYQPHLLILPEDDAYRDMANGFVNHFAIAERKIHIAVPARGWLNLLTSFLQEHVDVMRKYPRRHVLLLLDLDGQSTRDRDCLSQVPTDIQDRVFLLCSLDQAENIKREPGSGMFEAIGDKLAQSCYDGSHDSPNALWSCPQLQHNKAELDRLAAAVHPFLFYDP